MGTIAEKLTYLNTTKIKLRDSLNKFGSNILATDTFRSYDTKLNEIYDKLPKVTQNGAGFTLENVQNGQVDDFKMIGTDLEQNTTTGKNLFQSLITPSEFYKATYTKINENSFSLNYTQSSTSNFSAFARIDLDISKLKPDTEYTISTSNVIDGVNFSNIGALRTRINGVIGSVINSNSLTFTTPNTIENVGIYFYIAYMNTTTGTATITFNNIQVEEGSTATDYEPYTNGASPNPDYPQEIKVVEGRQVITDKGKNLFDKDNEIVGCVYNSSGTLVSSGNWNTNNEFKEINNNKISLSCKTTYPISFLLIEFDSNKTFIQRQQSTTTSYTFTLNNDTKYLRFCYLNNVGTYDIQLEEGSISTDYEPYHEPVSYNIDLQLANIYLAKMPNTDYKNRIYKNNGNWYFEEKVKKVVLDGSETGTVKNIGTNNWFYQLSVNGNPTDQTKQMCSHYNNVGIYNSNTNQGIMLETAGNYIRIRFGTEDTIENYKSWLSTNNVEVWYPLVNPVTTQITNTTLINQLEALYLHTGTNIITISNDNNIIPEIEITRLKELEKLS